MHVLINDYGGYPFILQLSEALAAGGWEVTHASYAPLTKFDPSTVADDVRVVQISDKRNLNRYRPVQRLRHELSFGSSVGRLIDSTQPDVVVTTNTPPIAASRIQRRADRTGTRYVHWLQDIHAVALDTYLRERVPLLGAGLARWFTALERRLLQRSAAIVAISDAFAPRLRKWGIPQERVTVIENWAELRPVASRHNRWSRLHELDDCRVVLYAGTLGLKHDAEFLVELADALRNADPKVKVMVIGHGPGHAQVRMRADEDGLRDHLLVLPHQPYGDLPLALGSADILLALLTAQASSYSVPSKVLTYLTTARPIVAAMPGDNAAAALLKQVGAGLVIDPPDAAVVATAVRELLEDTELCESMGSKGRAYAEEAFDLSVIRKQFEEVLGSEL